MRFQNPRNLTQFMVTETFVPTELQRRHGLNLPPSRRPASPRVELPSLAGRRKAAPGRPNPSLPRVLPGRARMKSQPAQPAETLAGAHQRIRQAGGQGHLPNSCQHDLRKPSSPPQPVEAVDIRRRDGERARGFDEVVPFTPERPDGLQDAVVFPLDDDPPVGERNRAGAAVKDGERVNPARRRRDVTTQVPRLRPRGSASSSRTMASAGFTTWPSLV